MLEKMKKRYPYKILGDNTRLNKNLNSNLLFGQASLNVYLPEQISHLSAFKKFKVIDDSQLQVCHKKNINLMTCLFPVIQLMVSKITSRKMPHKST